MTGRVKDWRFAVRLFHRRHVYEHNGGEVDQKYLDDSGDTSVKLKQHIHETAPSTPSSQRIVGKLSRDRTPAAISIFPSGLNGTVRCPAVGHQVVPGAGCSRMGRRYAARSLLSSWTCGRFSRSTPSIRSMRDRTSSSDRGFDLAALGPA